MTKVRLLSASLHYPPDLVLHTASSGRIAALEELYLVVEHGGTLTGFGEIRENITYLTGLTPADLRKAVIALAASLDWSAGPSAIQAEVQRSMSAPALARALLDTALVDWSARARNVPVCELFGATFAPTHSTNQSLFVSDDAHMLAMAERYVTRGFRKLKLRVGAGDFAADLRRLSMLRDRFDATIEIAIDANGRWSLDEALDRLGQLAPYSLAYAEQPIAAGDWTRIRDLCVRSPIPVMLDESVASADDVTRIIDLGGRALAHLKIAKLGGITPTIAAARRLAAAGVPVMIGQMNEGAGATAAAYHCAVATAPAHAELYGADGLLDDPVTGVTYADGHIGLAHAPGLGVAFDPAKLTCIWELKA